jgi:drug/metabolite transporter (DMT)-like permease
MNGPLLVALILSTCLAAVGQLLLKIGADRILNPSAWLNLYIFFGLALYAIGLVLWLYGLSRAPLHVVYPFAMLTFVLVGLLGIIVLGERPNLGTVTGWGVISVGIALVYFSSRHS